MKMNDRRTPFLFSYLLLTFSGLILLASCNDLYGQYGAFSVNGVVKDAKGNALTGVSVTVYCGTNTSGALLAAGTTNALGEYSLPIETSVCGSATSIYLTYQKTLYVSTNKTVTIPGSSPIGVSLATMTH